MSFSNKRNITPKNEEFSELKNFSNANINTLQNVALSNRNGEKLPNIDRPSDKEDIDSVKLKFINQKYQQTIQNRKNAISPQILNNRHLSPTELDDRHRNELEQVKQQKIVSQRFKSICKERTGYDTDKVFSMIQNHISQREQLLKEFEKQNDLNYIVQPKQLINDIQEETLSSLSGRLSRKEPIKKIHRLANTKNNTINSDRESTNQSPPRKNTTISSIVSNLNKGVDLSNSPLKYGMQNDRKSNLKRSPLIVEEVENNSRHNSIISNRGYESGRTSSLRANIISKDKDVILEINKDKHDKVFSLTSKIQRKKEMDNIILNQIKSKRNNEEVFEPQKCEEEPRFHAKCDPSAKINTELGSEAFMLKDQKLKEKNAEK